MTTQALENLARARAAHADAAVSLDQAVQANSALLVRAAEARAKIEEAVREAKANGDATGKWALQLRMATDDEADINALIAQSQATLNARNGALSSAGTAIQSAEQMARREEAEIHARELDSLVRELEGKLVEAVKARVALQNMIAPVKFAQNSCFKVYRASEQLKSIVVHSVIL